MPGVPGPQGPQGRDGTKGQIGDKGSQGMPGLRGDRGREGPPGKSGSRGIKGQQGLVGKKGERGIVGNQGLKGDKGEKGESAKASQASIVPQTNWKQCVWKSESGTSNGKIKVIRIRIITHSKENSFFLKYFKEERLPSHSPFANTLYITQLFIYISLLDLFERKKGKP